MKRLSGDAVDSDFMERYAFKSKFKINTRFSIKPKGVSDAARQALQCYEQVRVIGRPSAL